MVSRKGLTEHCFKRPLNHKGRLFTHINWDCAVVHSPSTFHTSFHIYWHFWLRSGLVPGDIHAGLSPALRGRWAHALYGFNCLCIMGLWSKYQELLSKKKKTPTGRRVCSASLHFCLSNQFIWKHFGSRRCEHSRADLCVFKSFFMSPWIPTLHVLGGCHAV